MSFLFHASRNVVAQSAAAVLLLLTAIVTARLLGPEGRGIYALFFTSAGLSAQFLYFGMTQANVYYQNRDPKPFNQILGNSLAFLITQSCLLALVLIIFHQPVSAFFPGQDKNLVLFLLWFAGSLQVAELIFMGLVLGRHDYDLYSLDLFFMASGILLSTAAAWFFPDQLAKVISIRILVTALVMIWLILALLRRTRSGFSFSLPVLKQQLRFGVKNYVQNLLNNLTSRMYLFFIAASAGGSAGAGLFSVAMLFGEPLRLIPNSLGPILFAQLAREDSLEENGRMTARVCRMIFGLSAIGMIIYVPLIPFVLKVVFGENYANIAFSCVFMAFGALIGIIFQIMSRFFTSRHLQIHTIKASLVAMAVALVSSILFIPSYGVAGGAVSFFISSLTLALVMLFYFRRFSGIPLWQILVIQKEDVNDFLNLSRSLLDKFRKKS